MTKFNRDQEIQDFDEWWEDYTMDSNRRTPIERLTAKDAWMERACHHHARESNNTEEPIYQFSMKYKITQKIGEPREQFGFISLVACNLDDAIEKAKKSLGRLGLKKFDAFELSVQEIISGS